MTVRHTTLLALYASVPFFCSFKFMTKDEHRREGEIIRKEMQTNDHCVKHNIGRVNRLLYMVTRKYTMAD
jgi:hypothetical protein